MNTSPLLQLSKDTLLLIPCSKTKQPGCKPSNALSILSALDPVSATALANARAALREKAGVDETLMPAYFRYSGEVYKYASTSIGGAVASGQRVLIVSGAYGVILANEPIGWYEKPLVLSDWPDGLLEACILDYARHEGIQSIIAIMARTSKYATLIRRLKRKGADLAVTLVSPVAHGGGAMVKVPRAQGQAIAALIKTHRLDKDWRSCPDGLSLIIENL